MARYKYTRENKIICERSKVNIGLFLHYQVSIYTNASEALHGSFYGLTFHIGAYSPNIDIKNKTEIERNSQKNLLYFFGLLENLFNSY